LAEALALKTDLGSAVLRVPGLGYPPADRCSGMYLVVGLGGSSGGGSRAGTGPLYQSYSSAVAPLPDCDGTMLSTPTPCLPFHHGGNSPARKVDLPRFLCPVQDECVGMDEEPLALFCGGTSSSDAIGFGALTAG
jgi:hypothetical protein